jgi:hypothetical protein
MMEEFYICRIIKIVYFEKTFTFGSRYALGAFVDVLNLLNTDTVVSAWESDDPELSTGNPFGRPKYRQPPQSWRLGLRFTF